MVRQVSCVLAGLLSALLAWPGPAVSQTSPPPTPPASAATRGTVVDISGAVIPDAEVVVRTRDGQSRTIRTDGGGQFDAGTLATQVRVTSEGFAPAEVSVGGSGALKWV